MKMLCYQKEKAVKKREYGIDALRIAAMLMIVVLHVMQFGGISDRNDLSDIQFFETWLIQALCYGAVNCYALISGYVGVKHKPKLSSLMTMWLQVAGYWSGLVIVMELLVPDRVNMSTWMTGLMPVMNQKYWYFTAYVLLFFMMPLLNELLIKSERKLLRQGLASVLGTVLLVTAFSGRDLFDFANGFSTAWLAALYLLGGYFRLYGNEEVVFGWAKKHGVWVYLGCSVLMALAYSLIFKYRALIPASLLQSRGLFYNYMSIPVVIYSIALLACFSAWVPGPRMSKWIARLAPATFGVYIIHVQTNVCDILFTNRFDWLVEISPWMMPLGVLLSALAIYMGCTVIEWIRLAVFRVLHIRQLCQMLVDNVQKVLFSK